MAPNKKKKSSGYEMMTFLLCENLRPVHFGWMLNPRAILFLGWVMHDEWNVAAVTFRCIISMKSSLVIVKYLIFLISEARRGKRSRVHWNTWAAWFIKSFVCGHKGLICPHLFRMLIILHCDSRFVFPSPGADGTRSLGCRVTSRTQEPLVHSAIVDTLVQSSVFPSGWTHYWSLWFWIFYLQAYFLDI